MDTELFGAEQGRDSLSQLFLSFVFLFNTISQTRLILSALSDLKLNALSRRAIIRDNTV